MDSNGLRFWMLSQLNDWLPPWRAVTAYIPGQGIVDPNGNIQIAQNAGTSNAIPPVWSATLSQTTVDAGISWINAGPGTWQATTAFSAGQYILDSTCNAPSRSRATEPRARQNPHGRLRWDSPWLTAM